MEIGTALAKVEKDQQDRPKKEDAEPEQKDMKLKRVLTVLFTSMMLLTFSSSANTATGIGDTKNKELQFHRET